LDTATVRPTAVRAMMTENTGMMSWYSPMTSAPISRESRMRYTNPRNWETILVPVRIRVP
jgi:hypothetical protein